MTSRLQGLFILKTAHSGVRSRSDHIFTTNEQNQTDATCAKNTSVGLFLIHTQVHLIFLHKHRSFGNTAILLMKAVWCSSKLWRWQKVEGPPAHFGFCQIPFNQNTFHDPQSEHRLLGTTTVEVTILNRPWNITQGLMRRDRIWLDLKLSHENGIFNLPTERSRCVFKQVN